MREVLGADPDPGGVLKAREEVASGAQASDPSRSRRIEQKTPEPQQPSGPARHEKGAGFCLPSRLLLGPRATRKGEQGWADQRPCYEVLAAGQGDRLQNFLLKSQERPPMVRDTQEAEWLRTLEIQETLTVAELLCGRTETASKIVQK